MRKEGSPSSPSPTSATTMGFTGCPPVAAIERASAPTSPKSRLGFWPLGLTLASGTLAL